MSDPLFSYTQDNNDIWHLKFYSGSRQAFAEYVQAINHLNAQILSGEIVTQMPIRILWDFEDGALPQVQHIILTAKMNPPPENFTYRIAYLLGSPSKAKMIPIITSELRQEGFERRIFINELRSSAINWLLAESSAQHD